MVNIFFLLEPLLAEHSRREQREGRVREIKTAFIPYGTNAAPCRVRGATQIRPVLTKNPVVMQREPASLFSSTTIWFML